MRLDALFAQEPEFQWYSTPSPGQRLGAEAKRRDTLIPYFKRRHAGGDRFRLRAFDWNGRSAHWSNFGFEALRSEPGEGGWFAVAGKGAVICDDERPRLIVLSLGGGPPDQ